METKNLTPLYLGEKILHGIKFIFQWIFIVGVIDLLFYHSWENILQLVLGVVFGEYELYHLWFLVALLLIYLLLIFVNEILKFSNHKIQDILGLQSTAAIILIMTFSFTVCVILYFKGCPEIRDIIPATFRIWTSAGYFILGMTIRKYDYIIDKFKGWFWVIVLEFAFLSILLISKLTGIKWASSYYDSLFAILGCTALLTVAMSLKFSEKIKEFILGVAETTTGIWILHPFILKLLRSFIASSGVYEGLKIRLLELVITLLISLVITKLFTHNRALKKLVIY